ncbi:hypothetical protein [Absidia glauca]|uniref:enoyl-[acyl-carrier-protein] reductase n=1 Tax=Absidia glauca TaxID=4829 RepID=A0A168QYR1_ABSGL|nr:hypothetical protein [Absidia glauca]
MILVRPSFLLGRFRTYSTARSSLTVDALVYPKYGRPTEVLKWHSYPLPALTPETVHVKFLASPINPADVNQLQGAYPVKPPFELLGNTDDTKYAVGGNEGVAQVIATGDKVTDLKVGDRVTMAKAGYGTWRTYAAGPVSDFQPLSKADKNVTDVQLATLSVNPCTAYRMLKDFVHLEKGDYVIQNGANSAVGQSVIQLAKAWGIKTVNVVRNRPDIDQLRDDLMQLGATHVITDDVLGSHETKTMIKEWGQPKLGLNCVGGKSATEMARHLSANGQFVTYGAMARAPLALPASLLIFKNLAFHGFWMTRWTDTHSMEERTEMVDDLVAMMARGDFVEPKWTQVDWKEDSVKSAVDHGIQGFGTGKQVILF